MIQSAHELMRCSRYTIELDQSLICNLKFKIIWPFYRL